MNGTQKYLSGNIHCQIKVHGQLGDDWRDYFDNLRFAYEGDDITVISGVVEDQAALHGLLAKIRNLGLSLLYIECHEVKESV